MNEIIYEEITNALVQNAYIVIEDIFSQELIAKLSKLAQDESRYKKAGISSSKKTHIDSTKRSDKTQWLDEDGDCVSRYLAFCEGLREYLNRSLYLGLTYYEAHFSIYEKGNFYEKHLDSFVGEKNRVVTTLLYLNEEWSERDEGELVIYDKDGEIVEKVMPKGNTMVVFVSDRFPHEVLKTQKKRYSIAGWFRVDNR